MAATIFAGCSTWIAPTALIPPPGGRALKASSDDDEQEGLSFEEIIGRLMAAYRFIRRNAGSFLTVGALVGSGSVLVLPPAREASCLIKLEPQVKGQPGRHAVQPRPPGGPRGWGVTPAPRRSREAERPPTFVSRKRGRGLGQRAHRTTDRSMSVR
jgi:hypothetical protein